MRPLENQGPHFYFDISHPPSKQPGQAVILLMNDQGVAVGVTVAPTVGTTVTVATPAPVPLLLVVVVVVVVRLLIFEPVPLGQKL